MSEKSDNSSPILYSQVKINCIMNFKSKSTGWAASSNFMISTLESLYYCIYFEGTLRIEEEEEMKFRLPTVPLFLFLVSLITIATAFDPYDPIGNITVRWDVMSWTPDGYVAVINITNSQRYRTVQYPGWTLGWTWAGPGHEIIWNAVGAQATEQGDCSRFIGNIPHSCSKTPNIVDLLPQTPYNQQVYGCCKGGILLSRYQDLYKSTAGFQISVGSSGSNNRTVRLPKNFTLEAGASGRVGGYTCGPAKIVRPTRFITADGRRVTQALMTWKVVCTYSSFLANKRPTCCVSVSSADQRVKATCPTCSCSCRNQNICNGIVAPAVKCTDHMCPTSIHWQMLPKSKKDETMGARVSITNFNNKFNYTDWTMLVNHPSINHLTTFLDANHRRIPSSTMNVVWGIKNKNRIINTSGAKGSTVSWVMNFKGASHKNYTAIGCNKNWCPPKAILFNGDACVFTSTT